MPHRSHTCHRGGDAAHQKVGKDTRVQTAWRDDDDVRVDECAHGLRHGPDGALERQLFDAGASSGNRGFSPNGFATLKLGVQRHVFGRRRKHTTSQAHQSAEPFDRRLELARHFRQCREEEIPDRVAGQVTAGERTDAAASPRTVSRPGRAQPGSCVHRQAAIFQVDSEGDRNCHCRR